MRIDCSLPRLKFDKTLHFGVAQVAQYMHSFLGLNLCNQFGNNEFDMYVHSRAAIKAWNSAWLSQNVLIMAYSELTCGWIDMGSGKSGYRGNQKSYKCVYILYILPFPMVNRK